MRKLIFLLTLFIVLFSRVAFGAFVVNGNGTVTDTSNGLMWQRETAGSMTWEAALNYCEGLSLGGYSDWRLPNINELQSLVDYTRYGPAIDNAAFPGTASSDYWSSTSSVYWSSTSADSTVYVRCVGFSDGKVYSNIVYCNDKSYSYYVRAVRGGQCDKEHEEPTIACTNNDNCAPDEYCQKSDGDCSGQGVCSTRQQVCTMMIDPVCGCDGKTYPSPCSAASAGVSVNHSGECPIQSCIYSIEPTKEIFGRNSGTGSIAVTAPGGCSWTAKSNDSWITITSITGNESGNGDVNYTVSALAYPGSQQRTGTITVAGKTFTVKQPGVELFGDTDGNGVINILDLSAVAKGFGAVSGQAAYKSQIDIDQNGVVNILDLILIVKNFGAF